MVLAWDVPENNLLAQSVGKASLCQCFESANE